MFKKVFKTHFSQYHPAKSEYLRAVAFQRQADIWHDIIHLHTMHGIEPMSAELSEEQLTLEYPYVSHERLGVDTGWHSEYQPPVNDTLTRELSRITRWAFINRVNHSFYGFSYLETNAEGISTITVPVNRWRLTRTQVAAERIAGTLADMPMEKRIQNGDVRPLTQLEILAYMVDKIDTKADAYLPLRSELERRVKALENLQGEEGWTNSTPEYIRQIRSRVTTST